MIDPTEGFGPPERDSIDELLDRLGELLRQGRKADAKSHLVDYIEERIDEVMLEQAILHDDGTRFSLEDVKARLGLDD